MLSISTSQLRPYTIDVTLLLLWLPAVRILGSAGAKFWTEVGVCTETVLAFCEEIPVGGVPSCAADCVPCDESASYETLVQLCTLLLRFERERRVLPPASLPSDRACALLASSYVRSGVLARSRMGKLRICDWMACTVLRTNWFRDMCVERSAMCRSVFRSRIEYATAWTTPSQIMNDEHEPVILMRCLLELPYRLLGLHSQ